ncbi:carboxylesterase family protein [Succiniclasticum ruminis]|uniref:Para-nitrobenzyl esterase n=1 Tax=Succiniclasticum ruminis DSM 9236 TaxID=1123323 RepID=A0A1I2D235_9FIRM|nr:carboxylesterase family protein [Succiniclasticum ruminis]SFE74582.1 para-nitrobenzyl esterase [Succiniclasticum ruminis DSM 9236]
MKKLFTVDDFMIAFVSALGYGLGYEIPKLLGWPDWQCLAVCFVAGFAMDFAVGRIIFSRAIQKKPAYRFVAFALFIFIFLAVQHIAMSWLGVSMLGHLLVQYRSVIAFPVLGFLLSMAVRWYRIRKVRRQYGDGSNGFVFDEALKTIDLDEVNRQNRPIRGAYDTGLAVKTKTGTYVGVKEKNIIYYSGIPYAKPPVGERRWKAPEPLPESEAVFEAQHLGASAIQVDHEGSILKHHRQSEDCLTLNICVGSKKTDRKKPVIVLFHHGDFAYGGSADPLMDGTSLIRTCPDVVGVSFNFRLGLFGFIDFSEVPGGEAYPDALNLGLLDQIAALRWIKENIAAFGGDPDRITVMGFESGAVSISLLAACEQAKGLFRKAFVFHGNPMAAFDTPEMSRMLAKKLLQETSAATMEELMQLSTEQLKEASQKLLMGLFLSGPVRDGKLISADVYEAYRNGTATDIEFLIGVASNERKIYRSFVGNQTYGDFISSELNVILRYLDEVSPPDAQAIRAYVREQAATVPEVEAKAKAVEQCSALGVYLSARKLAEGGNKVYLLYWNVKPLLENLGSGTVDVASAFLGNSDGAQLYGNVLDADISEVLRSFLVKFLRGDAMRFYNNEIRGVSAIEWERFPKALLVSDKGLRCGPVEDKLTEIKGLPEFIGKY